jgi:hypothetical protein
MTDECQLLDAGRAGDEDAVALLLAHYQDQLRADCCLMLWSTQ